MYAKLEQNESRPKTARISWGLALNQSSPKEKSHEQYQLESETSVCWGLNLKEERPLTPVFRTGKRHGVIGVDDLPLLVATQRPKTW